MRQAVLRSSDIEGGWGTTNLFYIVSPAKRKNARKKNRDTKNIGIVIFIVLRVETYTKNNDNDKHCYF